MRMIVSHYPICIEHLNCRIIGEFGSEEERGSFRAAVAKSVDDVVKDVGGEAASKAKARQGRLFAPAGEHFMCRDGLITKIRICESQFNSFNAIGLIYICLYACFCVFLEQLKR